MINPINSRLIALQDRAQRYPYKKSLEKLTEAEFDLIVEFIDDHDHLGHLEFEYAVNRMFLDKEKPKGWAVIQEILVVVNTAVLGNSR